MKSPFDPTKGLVVVLARLWGPEGDTVARMALDTGATGTLISWDVAVFLGYDPSAVQVRKQITTGSGVEFAPQIPIDRFEALGIKKSNFLVLCHTLPPTAGVHGGLGLDFLRGQRVVLDFRSGMLTLD